MKKFLFLFLMLLAFVLETKVPVLGVRLNLMLIFVYYIGLKHGQVRGIFFGAIVGALEDIVASGILGPGILGKATVGYLSSALTGGLFIWTPFLGLVWLFVLTAADGIISFASLSVFSHQPLPISIAFLTIFWQGLINCPFGFVFKPKHEDQQ